MNRPIFREMLLLVLLCIAVFIASTGGIQNQTLSTLLEGISVSVLATVVSSTFYKMLEKKES